MGSLSKLIKEKGMELDGIKTEKIRVQQIHYTKLKESGLNFYNRSEDEVAELADAMLIAGGILQPLIVRKTDLSEYEILAGHKRKRASVYNVGRGYKEYEFLPCIVIDMGGLMAKKISEKILAGNGGAEDDRLLDMIAEYIVICTNSTASESSDFEKMMQAVRLSEILPEMLGDEELKGRALRAEISKEMKYSDGQVGRYLGIHNNLIPEAMELFKEGKIKFSAACSLSGLDRDQQREALKRQLTTKADIDALKQDKNTETVSKLDTEKAAGAEPLKPERDKKTVSKLDTEKEPEDMPRENTPESNGGGEHGHEYEEYDEAGCGLAAAPDGNIEKTAASEESVQAQGAGYNMDTSDVIRNLTEMMGTADNKRDYETLGEALKRIKNERHKISVPCRIGDTLYSVIGEKVSACIVAGFRIDKENVYMETEENSFIRADKVGVYYFFEPELAEREFNRKWRENAEGHNNG